MKHVFFLIILLFSTLVFAQDSTKVKVEAPKIVSKLQYGKLFQINDLELKFVAVESDSRCPEGVSCVWAGEAVVLVDVIKNGKKLEQKKITFSPTSQVQNQIGNLFSSEGLNVSSINILPYPKYGDKIKTEEYYIQLKIED